MRPPLVLRFGRVEIRAWSISLYLNVTLKKKEQNAVVFLNTRKGRSPLLKQRSSPLRSERVLTIGPILGQEIFFSKVLLLTPWEGITYVPMGMLSILILKEVRNGLKGGASIGGVRQTKFTKGQNKKSSRVWSRGRISSTALKKGG